MLQMSAGAVGHDIVSNIISVIFVADVEIAGGRMAIRGSNQANCQLFAKYKHMQ